jgi:hypothetical protein
MGSYHKLDRKCTWVLCLNSDVAMHCPIYNALLPGGIWQVTLVVLLALADLF